MFNIHNKSRDAFMLDGMLAYNGYDWWWHSFTGINITTGEEKSFFIEFFTCNPALGGYDPVFGQLPENKENGIKPSYVMVKAGCWGEDHMELNRFFGWKRVTLREHAPYLVKVDDCFVSENKTCGSIDISPVEAAEHPEWMSDAGSISWNLDIDKKIAFNVGYGASAALRMAKAFEMYWHAEGMKTEFSGTVNVNGQQYIVIPKKSYGYSDKNWGKDFTSPWLWLSSNNLYSMVQQKQLKNSVFDIGGGRPKVYNLPLERKLLGAFYYEGTEYEYNFSKPWLLTNTRFNCKETKDEIIWKVWQTNSTSLIKVDVRCRKSDMININYESPDGQKRHNRLWNGGNGEGRIRLYHKRNGEYILVDDIMAKNVGCEYGEYEE